MPVSMPPVVIVRRPRGSDLEWDTSPSWFGGRPRLGDIPWPRTPAGVPFVFYAQIDLAELASVMDEPSFRRDGSLAFFIPWSAEDGLVDTHAVIHVPSDASGTVAPPDGAPGVLGWMGDDFYPSYQRPEFSRSFPRWPVKLERITTDRDGWEAVIRERYGKSEYAFSASTVQRLLGNKVLPHWWREAQVYAAALADVPTDPWNQRARHAKSIRYAEQQLSNAQGKGLSVTLGRMFGRAVSEDVSKATAALERELDRASIFEKQLRQVSSVSHDITVRAKSHAPHAQMDQDNILRLIAEQMYVREKLDSACGSLVPRYPGELTIDTIIAFATGEDEAYRSIPEVVRQFIDEKHLLPQGPLHQMFGEGDSIQTIASCENADHVMLLQLAYDDMMRWRFGDVGAYQFWIRPEDLGDGRWDRMRLTFESH